MTNKRVFSWALYDWANSAFAVTVMAGLFPIFYAEFWNYGVTSPESITFRLGMTNAIASLCVAAIAPILGAIADRSGKKSRFLMFFVFMGVVMSAALYFVGQGDWLTASVIYALGIIGFSGGNIIYDALLLNVTQGKKLDWVSSLGFSLGYLGGGLLFALDVLMVLKYESFGFSSADHAVLASFVTVAVWWAVFSVPIFLYVEDDLAKDKVSLRQAVRGGLSQLARTFREIRRLRMVALFLIGYWLYIDGVDTIIRMAGQYGLALGFERNDLIVALLITQFIGFPAALLFGWLGEKLGSKTGIYIGLTVYISISVWAIFMKEVVEFYALAVAIGLVQGGVQALSRSFYAKIIPINKSAEYFGFYNMWGKFAAVLGPALMGITASWTGNIRYSMFVVIALFIVGGLVLYFVDEEKGRRMAQKLAEE